MKLYRLSLFFCCFFWFVVFGCFFHITTKVLLGCFFFIYFILNLSFIKPTYLKYEKIIILFIVFISILAFVFIAGCGFMESVYEAEHQKLEKAALLAKEAALLAKEIEERENFEKTSSFLLFVYQIVEILSRKT